MILTIRNKIKKKNKIKINSKISKNKKKQTIKNNK